MSKEMNSSMAMIEIEEGFVMTFVHIPKGYKATSFNLENHNSTTVGRLNNFNRIKKIAKWKNSPQDDLVALFKKLLKSKDWDFEKYPNPYAFCSRIIKN